MAKNTFTILGIFAILVLSLMTVSAAIGVITFNGITMTVNETSLSDVITGEKYSFEVVVDNQNGTNYNVSFGASGWVWNKSGISIPSGTNETFIGTLTIGSTLTKSVIAKFYNISDSSQQLFQITETIDLSYYVAPLYGCIDSSANNYNSSANTDDGSCTYDPIATYCDEFFGEVGDLKIKNFYIDYNGNGDDEEWEALDEIMIEVDIKNTNSNDRVNDIIVEIKILDSSNNDVTSDFDLEDEEKPLGRISKKSTETVTFIIKELPTDVEEDTYTIYIRAYDEKDEAAQCVSMSNDFNDNSELFHEFDVVRENEAVIIKNSDLSETILASCGEKNIQVSFPVYNIGDEEEDKVLVQLYNNELDINKFYVIDSLRSGKGKGATFFISLPEELSKSRYSLDIFTFFAYDDDGDELDQAAYDENSDNIDRDFSVRLEILSCQAPAPIVNANLESEAKIGEELVVKATITNNGKDNDFIISALDFETWAEFVSITPQTASINKGEYTEVIITLRPTATGAQSFNINTIVDGESYKQLVLVNVDGKPGLFDGVLDGVSNMMLYTIVGIVVLIIVILLVLILKASGRRTKPEF